MITPRQIMELSELDTMLALATGIDQIVDFRERAKALHQYYIGIKESREFCNELIAARIRAERKCGQELLALPKRNGYRPADMGFDDQAPLHGIKKDKVYRWQWIARIPDELFETELLARLGSGDELTTNYFFELARTDRARKAGINTDRPAPQPVEVDVELFRHAFLAGIECLAKVGTVGRDQIALTMIYLESNLEQAIEAYKAQQARKGGDE